MVKYDPISLSFDTPELIKGLTVKLKPPIKIRQVFIYLNPGIGGRSWRVTLSTPRRLRECEIEFDRPETIHRLCVHFDPEEALVAETEKTLGSSKQYSFPKPRLRKRKRGDEE